MDATQGYNFLQLLLHAPDGSPMADLKHVLLQDGQYIPPDQRDVPQVWDRRDRAPFKILNAKEGIMSRVFGAYGSLFLNSNDVSAESLYDVISSASAAILDGTLTTNGYGQSLEVVTDDRACPKDLEADVVIIVSMDPVNLRSVRCGTLIAYAPHLRIAEVDADSNVAIFTEACEFRRAELKGGTIFAPSYRCPDGDYQAVRVISNNVVLDDDNNPMPWSQDLGTLDRAERNAIKNAAAAIGELAQVISEQEIEYLEEQDYQDLTTVAERLSYRGSSPFGRMPRNNRGRRHGRRNDGFFGYEMPEDDGWDDQPDMWASPRRRGRRFNNSNRNRDMRGRTTGLAGRLNRLEHYIGDLGRRFMGMPAQPQRPQRPVAPQQPQPQAQNINPTVSSANLTPSELASLNNMSCAQLRVILTPVTNATGMDTSNMSKSQLLAVVQATAPTYQEVITLSRALISAGVTGQASPQAPQPAPAQPQAAAANGVPNTPILP